MKLLAWDTSSKVGSIAAMEWDPASKENFYPRLVSEWTLNVENSFHSERLLWGIHHLLESARWKLEEVGAFAVGVGPGSFTGLRIGITTARTLAHTLGKPIVPVSSLAALARPVALWLKATEESSLVIAANDACKGEVYALWGSAVSVSDCACKADQDLPGLWKRGVEETVLQPENLVKELSKKLKTGMPWALVGDAGGVYPEILASLPRKKQIEVPTPYSGLVRGQYVGLLGWEAFQAGVAYEALKVHPRYLRDSDAELKLKQKASIARGQA